MVPPKLGESKGIGPGRLPGTPPLERRAADLGATIDSMYKVTSLDCFFWHLHISKLWCQLEATSAERCSLRVKIKHWVR